MSPGNILLLLSPPQISSKKKQKKKKKKTGSATVYTQYIQQKLVACTCTRHIFTWINMHALLFNILQISLSIRVRDKNHFHNIYM